MVQPVGHVLAAAVQDGDSDSLFTRISLSCKDVFLAGGSALRHQCSTSGAIAVRNLGNKFFYQTETKNAFAALLQQARKQVLAGAHLCCGSAGTYSVLNPKIAYELRDRKLGNLQALQPQGICSANIGCITHLQSGTDTPVRHWVEVLDTTLNAPLNAG